MQQISNPACGIRQYCQKSVIIMLLALFSCHVANHPLQIIDNEKQQISAATDSSLSFVPHKKSQLKKRCSHIQIRNHPKTAPVETARQQKLESHYHNSRFSKAALLTSATWYILARMKVHIEVKQSSRTPPSEPKKRSPTIDDTVPIHSKATESLPNYTLGQLHQATPSACAIGESLFVQSNLLPEDTKTSSNAG